MPGEMTEEEREHLRSLADQAKQEIASERLAGDPPEGFGEMTAEQQALIDEAKRRIEEIASEDSAYDLTGHAHGVEDERTPVKTAFLVFVDPASGRAIATTDIEETLAAIRIEEEASVIDMRRYTLEVLEDIRILLMTQSVTQNVIGQQLAMAQKAAEAADSARVAQSLGDLRDIRKGRK